MWSTPASFVEDTTIKIEAPLHISNDHTIPNEPEDKLGLDTKIFCQLSPQFPLKPAYSHEMTSSPWTPQLVIHPEDPDAMTSLSFVKFEPISVMFAWIAVLAVFSCWTQHVSAFQSTTPPQLKAAAACQSPQGQVIRPMGIFDDLKLIFSDEGKKNREEYKRQQFEEQEAIQREMLERRRNPEKMQEYYDDRRKRLKTLSEERDVYKFQNKIEKGYDPLKDWQRLREEGKIKIGEDLERDAKSARLGSEGLQDVRVDERMPYIDQGYVEEKKNDDPIGDFLGNVFGKK